MPTLTDHGEQADEGTWQVGLQVVEGALQVDRVVPGSRLLGREARVAAADVVLSGEHRHQLRQQRELNI